MKDSDAIDFDPLYVAATFLDHRYKLLLEPEQLHAKEEQWNLPKTILSILKLLLPGRKKS